jgi:uroporphyrinogen-III synthase
VRGFAQVLGVRYGMFIAVCIGPVTAREAKTQGFTVRRIARPHTVDGLVTAVEAALERPRRRGIVDWT